jgi:Holliday junction resolvase YEN1
VALSKLAVDHYERNRRAFRIAVDASIWQFQSHSGRGGKNPELRTIYYRLVRLLSLSIEPLFVFDGPKKPPFKRNISTKGQRLLLPTIQAQRMLKLFGFPFLTAPGEAEAECALLQREGVVDAVMSEDVDTLMFGATMVLRNWSSEATRGNKEPTHVNVFDSSAPTTGKPRLDREGIILVALMSGGDYQPKGLPRYGIKVACEAARGGFGRDLCGLDQDDTNGLAEWRARLEFELATNESGYFRTRHPSLKVPDSFPDGKVLGYYTCPEVSSSEDLLNFRSAILWNPGVDIQGLRSFVAECFDWKTISGARKLVRKLAPALLVNKLLTNDDPDLGSDDQDVKSRAEAKLIQHISKRRTHFSTDGIPELYVTFMPLGVTGFDLRLEEEDGDMEPNESDQEINDFEAGDEDRSRSRSPTKRTSKYDPTQPDKVWIPAGFAKVGAPLTVEIWEASMRAQQASTTRKPRERAGLGKGGMPAGAIERFFSSTKPNLAGGSVPRNPPLPVKKQVKPPEAVSKGRIESALPRLTAPPPKHKTTTGLIMLSGKKGTRTSARNPTASQLEASSSLRDSVVNPWIMARRPSNCDLPLLNQKNTSLPEIHGNPDPSVASKPAGASNPIIIASSPPPEKHNRSPSPPSRVASDQEQSTESKSLLGIGSSPFRPRHPALPTVIHDAHRRKKRSAVPQQTQTTAYSPKTPEQKYQDPWHDDDPPVPDGQSPSSPASSLPSLSQLISQSCFATASAVGPSQSTCCSDGVAANPESVGKSVAKNGGAVVVRDSLPGAFKFVEEWAAGDTPPRSYRNVGIVDLTEG